MYRLRMCNQYPKRYCFQHVFPGDASSADFFMCRKLKYKEPIIFILDKTVNMKRLLSYDFYASALGNFVSPGFAELLTHCENIAEDIQLLDSIVVINGKRYDGYKGLNIIRELPDCIDLDQSKHTTSIEGVKCFDEVVFKKDIPENFNMARVTKGENPGIVVISEKFRKLLEDNKIKGIDTSTNPAPVITKKDKVCAKRNPC